jgi:hypothetical protein
MSYSHSLAFWSALARIVLRFKQMICGFDRPELGAMLEDAASFRREYEECRRQARMTNNQASKAQWLLFANEWIKQAEATEALAKGEASEPAPRSKAAACREVRPPH